MQRALGEERERNPTQLRERGVQGLLPGAQPILAASEGLVETMMRRCTEGGEGGRVFQGGLA